MDVLGNIFYSEPFEELSLFRLDLNKGDIDQKALPNDIVGKFYEDGFWFTSTTSSVESQFESLPVEKDEIESKKVELSNEELWEQVYLRLLKKALKQQIDEEEFYPYDDAIFEGEYSTHYSGIEYRKGVEIDFLRNQDDNKVAIIVDRTYFAEDLDREDLPDDIPSPTPKTRFEETKNLFQRITPNSGESIVFDCFGEKIKIKFSPARWEK